MANTPPPDGYASWDAYCHVLAQNACLQHGALQDPLELAEFCAYAALHQPKTIVEIGSYKGGAWHALTHIAAPDAWCISIDYEWYSDEPKLKALALPGQTVRKISGNSHDHSTRDILTGMLKFREIDLLFIDGDHHYESVTRDHALYRPLVREGGIIAFHDIKRDESVEPGCEVYRYWRELRTVSRLAGRTFESVHGGSFGIGAYTKP